MVIQQHQPDGGEADRDRAAAALAEIKRRQERVIKAMLVPVWYWWVVAAAIVVIGVARDSGNSLVQAITIPVAVLVIAGVTALTFPAVRRRVQVHSTAQPGMRGAAAILALIVLINAVIIATAASLTAAHDAYPITIGSAAGAFVIVIGGPLVNRYLGTLMLSKARRRAGSAPHAAAKDI
jgi:hypothetical protein